MVYIYVHWTLRMSDVCILTIVHLFCISLPCCFVGTSEINATWKASRKISSGPGPRSNVSCCTGRYLLWQWSWTKMEQSYKTSFLLKCKVTQSVVSVLFFVTAPHVLWQHSSIDSVHLEEISKLILERKPNRSKHPGLRQRLRCNVCHEELQRYSPDLSGEALPCGWWLSAISLNSKKLNQKIRQYLFSMYGKLVNSTG